MLRRFILASIVPLLVAACSADAQTEDVTAAESTIAVAGFRTVDIRTAGGTVLKANVIEPGTPGRHPAIVLPSSWGLFDVEYVVQAKRLASAGYTVLSYTPRGFWASGGAIDTAGPKDVADARAVVDWLLAETSADPDHVGMAGVSYGAGISLLAAAHDPRVRAVGAISGWTDLVASLFSDETRRAQTVSMLALVARAVGRTSAEFDAVIADFENARNIDALKAWGRARGAATYIDALNTHRPAVLIANAYGDSIFPPNQLVDFYGAFTGPKRLELRAGDHAIPEATGLVGLPNDVWDSLRSWMDLHLRGSGGHGKDGIELHSQTGGRPERAHDWARVSSATRRLRLDPRPQAIELDHDTLAHGGVALVSGALDVLTGVAPLVSVPLVDRTHGAVWSSAPGALSLRGIPVLHASITPRRESGTVIAYLYDVDALGVGSLVTHAPFSWLEDPVTDEPRTFDLHFPAVSYDVAADHHLALVIDGRDALYSGWNEAGAAVTFGGASWLDLPLR